MSVPTLAAAPLSLLRHNEPPPGTLVRDTPGVPALGWIALEWADSLDDQDLAALLVNIGRVLVEGHIAGKGPRETLAAVRRECPTYWAIATGPQAGAAGSPVAGEGR